MMEEARDAFNLFDKKAKGFLNKKDLKDVFDEYLEISKAELDEIILELDKNGTENVSQKEFMALYLH